MYVHCLPNDRDLEPNNGEIQEAAEGHLNKLSNLNLKRENSIEKHNLPEVLLVLLLSNCDC